MRHKFMAAAGLATLLPGTALAQARPPAETPLHKALGAPDNLKINGSFRVRLEGIDGQFRPAPAASRDALLSFRTNLFAEYDTGPVRIGGELFDSRAYLEGRRSTIGTTEVNALELGQAYLGFDLGHALGTGTESTLTVGRFTMDIGARRLVARNQFRNTINAFTGARLDWQNHAKDSLRLFWTMPHYRLPDESARIRDNGVEWDRESPDLQFYGGVFTKAAVLGGTLELHAFQLRERDSQPVQTRNRRLLTPGMRLARAPKRGRFDFDMEADYQTGHARETAAASDRTDLRVSASFIHAELGRTFAAPWSPRVAVQYDRASGDGSNPGSYHRFDTLFGARRGEYGPTSLYGAVQRSNLSSPAVRLEVTPDQRWDGFVAYRALWLENATDAFSSTAVRDRSGGSGKFAGHQIEARARYWLVPRIARFDGGIAYLLKEHFLERAPNAPDGEDTRYAYVDLTLSF